MNARDDAGRALLAKNRFMAKVEIDPATGCWNWTRALNDDGYGVFWFDGRTVLAHRFAYVLVHGADSLPADTVLLHDCDNPRCVRHLHPGTQAENLDDARRKGRLKIGADGRFVLGPRGLAALAAAHESPRALARLNKVTAA